MISTLSPRTLALGIALLYLPFVAWKHWPLYFGYDLGGYYNYLTRGFLDGQLHVPIQPSKEILAAPNPQDPSLPPEWKMHDMVLYKGRYYLYHGMGPVLVLLAPWRLLTGFDLPEPLAGLVFVAMGIWALLLLARPTNPAPLVVIAFCSGALVVLPRIAVYELAISCGFACLAWAFVARAENTHQRDWQAGVLLGLALLSRPHLALAAVCFRWRSWVGLAVAGGVLAAYNYARFDSPMELGLKYLLSGPNQQVPQPTIGKALGACYLLTLQLPELRLSWPFLFPRWDAWFATPAGMYHEPIAGALFFAPFLVLLRRFRDPYFLCGALILCFVAITGWVTQRYLLDFLPWFVLAFLLQEAQPRWRWVLPGALCAVLICLAA
jgi:hypothetical protein